MNGFGSQTARYQFSFSSYFILHTSFWLISVSCRFVFICSTGGFFFFFLIFCHPANSPIFQFANWWDTPKSGYRLQCSRFINILSFWIHKTKLSKSKISAARIIQLRTSKYILLMRKENRTKKQKKNKQNWLIHQQYSDFLNRTWNACYVNNCAHHR